ncbi:MAG TPA: zinc ABC transporter substrate-binding protein [Acidimicrobiales bacterium]|nr:zinc ABC transporter substrate-binding protein [Acidimicrobiales bacterium]
MSLLAAAIAGAGCGGDRESDGRPNVVASFYPLAYAADRIGGDHVRVQNLTAPGVEPHDIELSPRQVDQIDAARLVFVLGRDFQPAVERVAKGHRGGIALLDQLRVAGDDPHVWLDPVLMEGVVGRIGIALRNADPVNGEDYVAHVNSLLDDLIALDGRYRTGLAHCARTEIVTNHEAFGRLAARYGLTQRAVTGLSPEAEPSPARLAELTDLIRRAGVTTVFTEELVSPRVAQALAREAGVRTEVLNPIEGLTKAQAKRGATYLTLMDTNLAKLRQALDCT